MVESLRQRSYVLLGLTLIATGALVHLQALRHEPSQGPAVVTIAIEPPDHGLLFNGTVHLRAGNTTALDALLEAAALAHFNVSVTHRYYGAAFVEAIAGHRNQGACGWLYEVNGRWADRSAGDFVLRTGDQVRWYWGCDG